MRLYQLQEGVNKGTFVGARLTGDSNSRLIEWINQKAIKNPATPDALHVTVALNKTEKFQHDPIRYVPSIPIDPSTFSIDMFGPEKNVLVLKFQSPFLTKRHFSLREKYGFPWDWDDYSPHLTLSYDSDNEDPGTPPFGLELDREYVEEFQNAAD